MPARGRPHRRGMSGKKITILGTRKFYRVQRDLLDSYRSKFKPKKMHTLNWSLHKIKFIFV